MRTLKTTLLLSAMMVTTITFTACVGKTSGETNSEITSGETNSEKLEGTKWFYEEEKDDLTGQVVALHATLISTNYKEIDHNNNTGRMAILLSYRPDAWGKRLESSVMFAFTDDNGLCRLADSGSSGILAVFDNGSVDDTWNLIYMSNDKTALSIISSYSGPNKVKAFIDKLKNSKQCKIQVRLNKVGNTTFTFNTEGLKWDFEN